MPNTITKLDRIGLWDNVATIPSRTPAPAVPRRKEQNTPIQSVQLIPGRLTVIIPAFNEGESIADTIDSLRYQTLDIIEEIIVVDDCSTDNTGEIAKSLGVTVKRPPQNTGSKAGAQNFVLPQVNTEFTMALDADTVLAPDALEKLFTAFGDDKQIAAVCGTVIPRHVRTIWERGRYVEYLFAFSFYKVLQDYYGKPLISSGCFSAYRTELLQALGGWNTRTMAEDMDLTWSAYERGYRVRFIPEAVCYPIEPHNFTFMYKQLKRWSHGFLQNVGVHWKSLLNIPLLRSVVGIALWDAAIASLAFLFAVPVLAVTVSPLFWLCYVMDVPAVLVPVMTMAHKRGEKLKALASIPGFLALRYLNALMFLQAIFKEWILRKPLTVYEKGH